MKGRGAASASYLDCYLDAAMVGRLSRLPGRLDRRGPGGGTMIKRVSFAAARRSRLTPWVAAAAVVAGAVVGGAEGVIHFNVLVVLIVGAVGAAGAGVGGVAAANRPRGISQVPGTVPAGPAGGPGLPRGMRRWWQRSMVPVVLLAVYLAGNGLFGIFAGMATGACEPSPAGDRCSAVIGEAWAVLLLTGVLIVLIAVAGSLPGRPAGQRIISFALGFAGPVLAWVAFGGAISQYYGQ